ncbi:hypothetical protein Tco_1246838 [Tanacetum coccineum]
MPSIYHKMALLPFKDKSVLHTLQHRFQMQARGAYITQKAADDRHNVPYWAWNVSFLIFWSIGSENEVIHLLDQETNLLLPLKENHCPERVKFGEAVENNRSEYGVGMALAITLKIQGPRKYHHKPYQ